MRTICLTSDDPARALLIQAQRLVTSFSEGNFAALSAYCGFSACTNVRLSHKVRPGHHAT